MPEKYAILTISLGERDYLKYTLKSMKNYAKKLSCELIVITEWDNFKDRKNNSNRFIKLEIIHHFCQQYDRLIYFDDTVYINPKANNLFEIVPNYFLGAWIESNIKDRKQVMINAMNYYSNFDNWTNYPKDPIMINSGVLVLSKNHYNIFDSSNYILKNFGFNDQEFISYKICKMNINIHDIGNENNFVGSQIQNHIQNKELAEKLYKNILIFHVTSGTGLRIKILEKLVNRFEKNIKEK